MNRRDFLSVATLLPMPPSGPKKNCILIKLVGGPSQLDTWDPKPNAPSHIRSPYKSIKTNVPGIEISEIFPRMARHADKYALIRGCYHTGEPVHEKSLSVGRTPWSAADPPVGPRRSFSQSLRAAVHAIESGRAPVNITINMFDSLYHQPTWDGHGFAPFSRMSCYRDHVGPMFDMAYSTLLQDLHDRGLLATTLVVATGEFGRTPRINPAGGRDHWPQCWTMLMAGGGVQGGQVIGASDAHAAEPKDRPVSHEEVAATIEYATGVPAKGQPVLELFRC